MIRSLQELMAEKVRLELDSKKLRGDLTAAHLRSREGFPGLVFPSVSTIFGVILKGDGWLSW
jgi:hypothetical protein